MHLIDCLKRMLSIDPINQSNGMHKLTIPIAYRLLQP